tara:strand:+ start:198 stop:395 length:198 start_codon:yes stop_codon:yes gene_type:complete
LFGVIISTYTKEDFMTYTTEQFDKDVEGLRKLIKMCEDLERENNKKADALIKQINGENAFFWRAY